MDTKEKDSKEKNVSTMSGLPINSPKISQGQRLIKQMPEQKVKSKTSVFLNFSYDVFQVIFEHLPWQQTVILGRVNKLFRDFSRLFLLENEFSYLLKPMQIVEVGHSGIWAEVDGEYKALNSHTTEIIYKELCEAEYPDFPPFGKALFLGIKNPKTPWEEFLQIFEKFYGRTKINLEKMGVSREAFYVRLLFETRDSNGRNFFNWGRRVGNLNVLEKVSMWGVDSCLIEPNSRDWDSRKLLSFREHDIETATFDLYEYGSYVWGLLNGLTFLTNQFIADQHIILNIKLHIAVFCNREDIVKTIFENADADQKRFLLKPVCSFSEPAYNNSESAFDLSVRLGYVDLIKLLFKYHCQTAIPEIHPDDKKAVTQMFKNLYPIGVPRYKQPLHSAINITVTKLLLNLGMDVDTPDWQGLRLLTKIISDPKKPKFDKWLFMILCFNPNLKVKNIFGSSIEKLAKQNKVFNKLEHALKITGQQRLGSGLKLERKGIEKRKREDGEETSKLSVKKHRSSLQVSFSGSRSSFFNSDGEGEGVATMDDDSISTASFQLPAKLEFVTITAKL